MKLTLHFSVLGVIFVDALDSLVTLISNVGFPIFACIMMFKTIDKEREDHKIESNKWIEALNNNTNVMQKLLDRLEGSDGRT